MTNVALISNEQEIVQQRVFMSWINHFVPNCIESNLVEELRDGTKLIALLYALTGEKIHEERGRHLKRIHFICNVQRALDFLQNKGLELINIRATDIVDGNPRIILGLIWIIILRFHIEEFMRLWHLETNESHHMFDHSFIPAQHRSAWKQDLKYKQFGTQLENSSSSIQTNECITTTSSDENNFSV
ncbi:Nesprin-1-like protein, partial [Leptotrombidium deliense]